MLLQFNVKNFMSIKDEIVLSLMPNADKEHADSLITVNKEKALPSIAIYGANAAGKSNIFRALTVAIIMVRNSNNMQINTPTGIIPFLLDDNSCFEKTKIDFKFVHNGIKYDYGFVGDQTTIYEEYLYEYRSSRPSMVFERTNINDYKFTTATSDLNKFKDKNTSNKLFLCTATAWNCELTKNAFMWFVEGIDTFYSLNIRNDNQFFYILEKQKDNSLYKNLILEMLQHADLNITDYEFESKEITDKSKLQLPPGISISADIENTLLKNLREYKLTTHHKIESDGVLKDFVLDINMESDGTRLMMAYAPLIIESIEKGRTLVVDEIDSCMHTLLLEYIISIFNDSKINTNGAQLIFNSHDVSILDLDYFRRDQIFFVEKNNSTGITELYSLADYSPRKSENIRKGYIQGRYGAIPAIIGGFEWEKG